MPEFVFGIKGLDELLPGVLYRGTTIVIAGHPGAGKTIFATTICYNNARYSSKKCLYISFQEPKMKLYRVMKSLGMDLEDLEKKGLFKFVNLPIAASCEVIADTISKALNEYKPDIVVVDSINAVLETVEDPKRRAWLQNFFYQLTNITNGLSIIIAEIPYGMERPGIGVVEFVSDALFVLKHYVRENKLARILEIRKARGAPISVTEVPFQIMEGVGIKVFVPQVLREIKSTGSVYRFTIPVFQELSSDIRGDESILIMVPSYTRLWFDFLCLTLMDLALTNNLRILFVSYKRSVDHLMARAREQFVKIFKDVEIANSVLEKYFVFESINPYAMSTEEDLLYETELVVNQNVDVVVFHGVEVLVPELMTDPYKYYDSLVDQLYYLRSLGKLVVRVSSYIGKEQFRMYASLADIVIRIFMRKEQERLEPYLFIWRRGRKPAILRLEDVEKRVMEALPKSVEQFKKLIKEHATTS